MNFFSNIKDKVREIYSSEGFLRDLPEIPGACKAIKEMQAMEK